MTDKAKIMAVVEEMRRTYDWWTEGGRKSHAACLVEEWADRLTALCAEAGVQEPVASQSLIDAAREECARVCDRFVRYAILGAGGLEPGDRLAQVSREIRALIGQPLNEAKGG